MPPIDYFAFGSTLILLTLILSVAYYSTKILTQMQKGMLESSWTYMSQGALILTGAVLDAMFHYLFASDNIIYTATSFVGPTLFIVGSAYIIAGFRAHYLAWNPNHPKVKMAELIEQ